jgi:hypothetical protein
MASLIDWVLGLHRHRSLGRSRELEAPAGPDDGALYVAKRNGRGLIVLEGGQAYLAQHGPGDPRRGG